MTSTHILNLQQSGKKMHPIYPTIRKTHCQHPKQTLAVFDDALMVLARCMRRWCRANAKARKKTDLRHKAVPLYWLFDRDSYSGIE